jgi:hypothetical protein
MASVMRFDQWQDSQGKNRVSGFNASTTITASDATWAVPTLGSPFVKVTVIGGGGGGGADASTAQNAGDGGTTTFNAGSAGTVTANGGLKGTNSRAPATGQTATTGFASSNGGAGGSQSSVNEFNGQFGNGGFITVAYLNLSAISTVNVTIGAGGVAGTNAAAGGRGEVIVEYVTA